MAHPHTAERLKRLLNRALFLGSLGVVAWQLAASPAAAQPDAANRAQEAQTIAFGSRTIQLRVDHLPGNQAWAERVTQVVVASGSVLEGIIGVPYPGPDAMTVSERTSDQLSGYAGMAGCSHVVCNIRLQSDFDDTTLLHELTHAWTPSFRNRWLAEGMSEYVSYRASRLIEGRSYPAVQLAGDRPPFPLLDWLITVELTQASEEEVQAVYEGYYWSERLFEQLEAAVGRDALKRTMVSVVPAPAGTVGVRRFIDALDEAGAQADDLFIRYVFPPERESEVRDRRVARDRLAALSARSAAEAPELSQDVLSPLREQLAAWEFAPVIASLNRLEQGLSAYLQVRDQLPVLRSQADQAGLPHPYAFDDAVQTWAFAPLLESIDDYAPAVEAYTTAKARLSEPRSLRQKLGLLGGDRPESHLDAAAAHFAAANFRGSADESHAAEAALEEAHTRAVRNGAIGVAILVLLLTSAALVLRWALTGQPSVSAASESQPSD
jgi:hypothetical protein